MSFRSVSPNSDVFFLEYNHRRKRNRRVQLGTKHTAPPGGATSKRLGSFWPVWSLTSGVTWKRHVFCPQLYYFFFFFSKNWSFFWRLWWSWWNHGACTRRFLWFILGKKCRVYSNLWKKNREAVYGIIQSHVEKKTPLNKMVSQKKWYWKTRILGDIFQTAPWKS